MVGMLRISVKESRDQETGSRAQERKTEVFRMTWVERFPFFVFVHLTSVSPVVVGEIICPLHSDRPSCEQANQRSCSSGCKNAADCYLSTKQKEKLMNMYRRLLIPCGLAASLAMMAATGVAQDAPKTGPATIQGMVIAKEGATITVRTGDMQNVTVVLSDNTKATEKRGLMGMDRKTISMANLAPGLQVRVEGTYDGNQQLDANRVIFSRSSLTTAQQIDAGLNPVAQQVVTAQGPLKVDRKDIEQSQQNITKNSQDIDTTKQGLDTTTQATNTNTQAIGQTNQRVGSLDQYETKDSYTVNFANGKTTVSENDKQQLEEFIKSAANTPGFMIEVQGYASKVGSAELNQRLSSERAEAVVAIIQQTGEVPLTHILAPAAMGTTDQTGDNHTRSGQAQNRRVVVAILVNKGIAGE